MRASISVQVGDITAVDTGVGGLALDECAESMVSAAAEYLQNPESGVREIVFVVRDRDAERIFQAAVDRLADHA